MDTAGRIVVPKPLRQALDLKPGQALEIRADGPLEIEIAANKSVDTSLRILRGFDRLRS
jgi:AbrB family looped-hinge helix DNA binding protein